MPQEVVVTRRADGPGHSRGRADVHGGVLAVPAASWHAAGVAQRQAIAAAAALPTPELDDLAHDGTPLVVDRLSPTELGSLERRRQRAEEDLGVPVVAWGAPSRGTLLPLAALLGLAALSVVVGLVLAGWAGALGGLLAGLLLAAGGLAQHLRAVWADRRAASAAVDAQADAVAAAHARLGDLHPRIHALRRASLDDGVPAPLQADLWSALERLESTEATARAGAEDLLAHCTRLLQGPGLARTGEEDPLARLRRIEAAARATRRDLS